MSLAAAPDLEMVPEAARKLKRRTATLFDVVAGRIGVNGFLTEEQLASSRSIPLAPEEVLLRSTKAPHHVPDQFYSAESKLSDNDPLPESDLLKSIHTYAADFYARSTSDKGRHDFKSLDETALIAVGVLIEEAAREMLGENGDMALVEPSGLDDGAHESMRTKHQIKGRVYARLSPHYAREDSEDLQADEASVERDKDEEDEESPKKRRR
ncbi:hypothetical protein DV736_g1908, partial [Chaetothyriales sp. CBS 134916]